MSEKLGQVKREVEGGKVRQVGWLDLYRWTREGQLRFFKSYQRLSAARTTVRTYQTLGVTLLVRQTLVGRAQWSQYSEVSSSGLGYTEEQGLDRYVEIGKTRSLVDEAEQLAFDFAGVS